MAYIQHTCREPGYSPLRKPCAACIAQLSKNGAALSAKRRGRSS